MPAQVIVVIALAKIIARYVQIIRLFKKMSYQIQVFAYNNVRMDILNLIIPKIIFVCNVIKVVQHAMHQIHAFLVKTIIQYF